MKECFCTSDERKRYEHLKEWCLMFFLKYECFEEHEILTVSQYMVINLSDKFMIEDPYFLEKIQ